MKLIGWIVALVVIAAAAAAAYYYVIRPGMPAPSDAPPATTAGGEEEPPANSTQQGLMPGGEVRPGEQAAGPVGTQVLPEESSFSWTFGGVGTEDAPRTTVTLHSNLGTKELGTFDGNCTALKDSAWAALPGEVDGAICFFAGFGTEIAIFKEGAIYVAKKGDLEEGTEETGSVRGDFEVIGAL